MADSQQHLNLNGQHLHSSNHAIRAVQALSSSASLPSSSVIESSQGASNVAGMVGTSGSHLTMGQAADNGSVMIPLSSGDLDLLRTGNINFSAGSASSVNHNSESMTITSSAMGTDISAAGGAVFTGGPSSSGFVLNGVVDESGNVLFETVEPDVGQHSQFLQPQLQNHHHQHQHQQLEQIASGMNASSSDVSSNRILDPQGLGLLNLHGAISTAQSDTITTSNPNFSGVNVQSSSAAGLIQALSAVNREMSNQNGFPSLLPVSATQGESSASTSGVNSQGLVTFNPTGPDDSASTANTAQVFLTQQQQQHQQQQHQILNIMLGGGVASSSNIISNTPSVNLHHRRRETTAVTRLAREDNSVSVSGNSSGAGAMPSLRQNNNSVVTVSLDQQLRQHEEDQQHQQQHHSQQLWVQPDQDRLLPSQSAGNSGSLGISQLATAVDSATSSNQHGGQLSEVTGTFQPLTHHPGGSSGNNGGGSFHDIQSQFTGIFNQQQHSAYQVAAPSSSSNFGPASPGDQAHPYAVIGGDSEATPSNPGSSQQQQQQQQHVVVESQAVDSSCLQQEQYTLVFDAGSQILRIQRMRSPSDCTVSQSVLSMEGSEAQPSPAPASLSTQTYSQAQVNHSMPATFASGSSSQEVTTSTMPPQLRHMSDRPRPSGIDSIYNRRQTENDPNSTSGLSSVMLKLEKSDVDGVPECDTTQEDIDGYEHETTSYMDTSNNIDDAHGELDSTVLQPTMQRSEALSSMEVAMDTAPDNDDLTPLQAVAMETSREMIQAGAAVDSLSAGTSVCISEPHSVQLASFLADEPSTSAAPAPQAQSVRKSRRLELVAQESRVSLKKRNYKSKHYDSTMLWCEDCMDAFSDQCPVHRLTAVPDKIVLSRAWASCPNQIQICRLSEAQLAPGESSVGVFAKRQIPKFTQFGPFLGVLVDALEQVTRQYFPLLLDLPNKPRQYFETADENECNWMMFVRPARTFAEQNLVAYQHKRNVFFSSTKIIEPRQELKVWYAAPYAEQMGVKTLELTEDDIQALDEADGRFACSECSRRFKSWATLQRHLTTHEEDDLEEEEVQENKMALLQEYASAEADGDADFVPGIEEGRGRQLTSNVGAQQRMKAGASLRGRLRHGKGRLSVSDGNRKKTTFLAKTLKKYKRAQGQRPCSDNVLQTMKGMYRRRGKLSGGNEWMCTHCGLTFDNASLLNLHTLTHAAEDVGMDEIRKLAAPQALETTAEVCNNLNGVPANSSPGAAGDASFQAAPPVVSGAYDGEAKPVMIVACPKCNMIFNDHKELMDHVSTHAQKPLGKDGRPFCCGLCTKSFSSAEKLARHQMVHGDESEKPLECTVCSKRVMTNSAMACHMKTHSDRKYFDCPICGTDFDTAAGLREHAQISHADQSGRFPCKECPKIFEDFGLLKKHVRSFHSNRVFQCPECSKVFPRVDKLRLHMLRHTSHREFMCETCGRQFKRKDKLREHMKRLHGKERMEQPGLGANVVEDQQTPPTTKFTPKVMPSEYHRFIYKCHTCLLGFKRRGMLVNHLAKRHPEIRLEQVPELNLPILKTQKDFYCQYCDKIYKSASKRKAHIQKMHPGCAIPPSARKKLPEQLGEAGDAAAVGSSSGGGSVVGGFNNSSFSHTVSSITTMPHGCKFCHKQYASKAKLIQHQRKQHPEVAEPQNSSRRKIKKTDPDMLQIAVGGEERFESMLPITVVNQGGDTTSLQATDLLNLAMSELNYSGAGGVANLSSLISSLGGGTAATNPAGGGAMVHIQSSSGQLQPATIDLSQLSQLNQALQTFTVAGQQGAAPGSVTTVLQTPLSPSQHQQHQQQLQQHHQQIQLQQQQLQQQQQQQQQQLTVVTPNGSQTINLSTGGQFIARAWPANFATQSFR